MINLLPKEIKQKYQVTSKVYGLAGIYILVLVIIGLGAAGLETYNYIQQTNLSQKQAELASLNSTQLKSSDLAKEAAFIDNRLTAQATFQDSRSWDTLVNTVATDTPSGVQLTDIKFTTTPTLSLAITGQVTDQRQAILFEQKLASDKAFTSAQITSMSGSTSGKIVTYSFAITAGISNQGATK